MGIRESLQAAVEYLAEHPEDARYADSAATATVVEGLRCRVSGPGGAELVTDMPASVGGAGAAPSPGWFLRAAAASCVATLATMRAAQLGHELPLLEVTVTSDSDDRGILGLDSTVPAGPLATRVAVRIDCPAGPEVARAIAAWAADHCPVTDAVGRAVPLSVVIDAG
jgi:uncharacterized OsmC-like protein